MTNSTHSKLPNWQQALRALTTNGQLTLGSVLLILMVTLAFSESVVRPFDPSVVDLSMRLQPPGTGGHIWGTDELGRDLFSRVLAGTPWSLGIAFTASSIGAIVGTAIGMAAGWSPGIARAVLTRIVDIGIAFPALIIAVVVLALVDRGFVTLAITLGFVSWPAFARVVYAETSSLRHREFITATRIMGASSLRTVIVHVFPGVRSTLFVMWAFMFADMLIAESGLSFLGLGAPLGTPTWGNLLSASRSYLTSNPFLMIAPGAAIVIVVIAANLFGDGLANRDRNSRRAQ